MFIAINFNGSINKIEENWETPTFFIQDGGHLFTNSMSGAARLPALVFVKLTLLDNVRHNGNGCISVYNKGGDYTICDHMKRRCLAQQKHTTCLKHIVCAPLFTAYVKAHVLFLK